MEKLPPKSFKVLLTKHEVREFIIVCSTVTNKLKSGLVFYDQLNFWSIGFSINT